MAAMCHMALISRVRGAVLRLVRHRARSVAIGLLLALPSLWVQVSPPWDAWWLESLSLIVGATGLALFWTGLTGAAPDWVDPDGRENQEVRTFRLQRLSVEGAQARDAVESRDAAESPGAAGAPGAPDARPAPPDARPRDVPRRPGDYRGTVGRDDRPA